MPLVASADSRLQAAAEWKEEEKVTKGMAKKHLSNDKVATKDYNGKYAC